jgi:hypothetical protein
MAAVSTAAAGPSAKYDTVVAIPITGGDPREIFKAPAGHSASVLAWAPRDEALLIRTSTGSATVPGELWWVPLASGDPQRIVMKAGEDVTAAWVSPDGRRLAYAIRQPETPQELWVLENFLAPDAKKQ